MSEENKTHPSSETEMERNALVTLVEKRIEQGAFSKEQLEEMLNYSLRYEKSSIERESLSFDKEFVDALKLKTKRHSNNASEKTKLITDIILALGYIALFFAALWSAIYSDNEKVQGAASFMTGIFIPFLLFIAAKRFL